MAISYTYCGANRAYDGTGGTADGLGPSEGNAVAVADGNPSGALAKTGWYRIVATSASLLQYGPSVTNGESGEVWPSGTIEARFLKEGFKIGVSAG